MLIALLIVLHALSAVVWVGGMAFAYMVLRPAVDAQTAEVRLTVLAAVFRKFFIWVWHAAVLLPLTGFILIFMLYAGFAGASPYIHVMMGLGLIMIALFIYLFFGPYPPFKRAVADADWATAAIHLPRIRRIILVNFILGLATVIVGSGGRFWP